MTMFCGANTSNGAVRGGDEGVLRDPRFVNVPSITLDQLFLDAERLDLIKIDIEGHEPKALRGAEKVIRKHRPVIICANFRQPILKRQNAAIPLNSCSSFSAWAIRPKCFTEPPSLKMWAHQPRP